MQRECLLVRMTRSWWSRPTTALTATPHLLLRAAASDSSAFKRVRVEVFGARWRRGISSQPSAGVRFSTPVGGDTSWLVDVQDSNHDEHNEPQGWMKHISTEPATARSSIVRASSAAAVTVGMCRINTIRARTVNTRAISTQ